VKITRINKGIYEVSAAGRVFQIEAFKANDWLLFEIVGEFGTREYMRDFWTKRRALEALKEYLA